MSRLLVQVKRSTLPLLVVLCLAALSVSYAFADEAQRPPATQIIGDPDAAVTGKFAVGTATPGHKALTVVGVIDFLGAGTVHNYFTQGTGNNMQINTNVDEANTVGDATKSQWKLVLGSSLDWFSIRRSPAGGTYNEDALFFIEGSTGRVGIATVDTGNLPTIPFTPQAKLDVETTSGNAIIGHSASTSGFYAGVEGWSYSTMGNGVRGYALASTGPAWGVNAQSLSPEGGGVFASAYSSTGSGYGVYADSYGPAGVGVVGNAAADSGTTFGVYGTAKSPIGTGVYGFAADTGGSNYGVYGQTASAVGKGVYGYAPSFGTAVYGDNSDPSGWAGYFTGDVGVGNNLYVTGSIYKSADYFRIDHPLDPTKYLNHSVVESPDMMNIYNGIVALDESGQAWVQLPDWFEALNKDFRYQLTPIGEFAPIYISQEIQDNRFQIAGGTAGMEVSWQVTGIRHDAYAEAHRIPVVEDKTTSEEAKLQIEVPPANPPHLSIPPVQPPVIAASPAEPPG